MTHNALLFLFVIWLGFEPGVTASSAPEDLAAMRRAGVDAVIHKPVAPAQIVEQVRNILSNRSISGARAA